MKSLKLITAGLLAIGCVASTFATTVKVTGSTAFRRALYAAVINQLGSGTVKVAYIGSSLGGANQATFTNGTDTVQACMAGSVGGINWIANNINVSTSVGGNTAQAWIATTGSAGWATAAIGAGPAFTITGGTAFTTGTATFEGASIADFTMSDSLQDSSPYSSTVTGITLTQAQGSGLGVVQFLMAKGTQRAGIPSASYNALTNVSALAFQNLAGNGVVPLSAFTGVSTDSAFNVVLVGRDNDSGTRLASTFETGLGSVDTSMTQFRAFDGANDVGSGTGVTIKTIAPAGGGTAGYASGSNVKKVLDAAVDPTAVFAGKPFIVIGYVGTADKPAVASQNLNYAGVAQTDAGTIFGQYTFWTYEQAYYKPTLAGAKAAIVESLAGTILSDYATAAGGIKMGDMQASRGAEGTVVSPF